MPFRSPRSREVQVEPHQHVARRDQALAVDQRRGRELADHRRRHQRPRLHEEVGLHGPRRAVQGEVDDRVAVLQRPVGGVEQRGFGAEAVGPAEGRLGDHRRLAVVAGIDRRVGEELGLARLFGLEPQRAAVAVGVPVADRPARVVALVIAAEVAVAVDEVAGRVAVLLQRPEDFRAGRGPVRRGDQPLEAQFAEVLVRLLIEPPLVRDQEPGRVLVARRSSR